MKAIILIEKTTVAEYLALNGKTCEVKNLGEKTATLIVEGQELDFALTEIIIFNLDTEIQKAYDNLNWGSDYNTYQRLQNYCTVRGFGYKKPEYNCPA